MSRFLYENVCYEEDIISKLLIWTGTEYARIYHKNSPPLPHSHVDSSYVIEHNIVPETAHFIGVIREPLERQLSLYLYRIRDAKYEVRLPSPEHFRSLFIDGMLKDKTQQMQPQSTFINKELSHTYWLFDTVDKHLTDFCITNNIEIKSPLQVMNRSPGNTKKLVDIFYTEELKNQVREAYEEDFILYNKVLNIYK